MRKLTIALSVAMLFLAACTKSTFNELTPFETKIEPALITIPAISRAGAQDTAIATVRYSLDSAIKANTKERFDLADAKYVRIKAVKIHFLDTEDANASNFESLRLVVAAGDKKKALNIAQTDVPDIETDKVNIVVMRSPELKGEWLGKELTYKLVCKTRRPTTRPLKATVSILLSVD